MVSFKTALSLYSGNCDQGNFRGKVQCMCSHPSLAWVACVSVGSNDTTAMTILGSNNVHSEQSITVWDYQQGETLVQWTYLDLLELVKHYKTTAAPTTNLGSIRTVKFMDRHTLYWDGCHPQQNESTKNSYDDQPLLIVLFELEVVILYLRNYSSNTDTTQKNHGRIYSTLSYTQLVTNNSIIAKNISKNANASSSSTQQQQMSSNACYPTCVQPITSNLVIVGCSDGSIQFWNIQEKTIIRVLKSHQQQSLSSSAQNTPAVLQIIPAVSTSDLYAAEHTATPHQETNNSATTSSIASMYRFVTVASNGIAHVWKMQITTSRSSPNNDDDTDESSSFSSSASSTIYTLKIRRPLATLQSLFVSNNSSMTSISTTAHYDMERDLFFSPISNMKYLAAWDFSCIPNNTNTKASSGEDNIPIFSPFLRIITSPNILLPTATTSSSNKDWILIPAQNPYYTNESCIAFWMANKSTGDAFFMVSSVQENNNNSEVKPEIHHECTLQSLDYVNATADTFSKQQQSANSKLKLSCWIVPHSSETVICGTNAGILKLEVVPQMKIRSGTRHVILSEYSDSTKQVVVLFVEGLSVFIATLDASQLNPIGPLIVKNPCLVYKSVVVAEDSRSADFNETTTIDHNNNNSIRLPPKLFLSPSKSFVCLFWSFEMRYEILHVKSLLDQASSNNANRQIVPLIETGTGIRSFAWEGWHDVFAILRVPQIRASSTTPTQQTTTATKQSTSTPRFDFSSKLKKSPSFKLSSLLPSSNTPVSSGGNNINNNPDTPSSSTGAAAGGITSPNNPTMKRYSSDAVVELRMLIVVKADAISMSSCAAATVRSIGELPLRGGQPVHLFGGVHLCVASTHPGTSSAESNRNYYDSSDGLAYFYSRKQATAASDASSSTAALWDLKASSYSASGPSLPIPDIVEWSDDGKYCCACFGSRVAIYLARQPEFALIGTAMLVNPFDGARSAVESVKFLQGVLFCATFNSVHLIFLGSISTDTGGITSGDCHMLASMHVPLIRDSSNSFPPIALPMSLGSPAPLTFFAGSLVVSTFLGIQAIPLDNPLYRIGILLAAGHIERACPWFQGIDRKHHEVLGRFLERRGFPELAVSLPGLSITSVVDMCIRWRLTKVLEDLIEAHGLESIRDIDIGSNLSFGAIECVGTFLLSEGKSDLVRQIASECIVSGDEMRREALVLASLMLSVDPSDARRLVKRAVGAKGKVDEDKCWPVANFVRNNLL